MESIIKWEKGLPTDGGRYIITMQGVGVTTAAFIPGNAYDEHFFKEYVTAWCKLGDIEPYNERMRNYFQK